MRRILFHIFCISWIITFAIFGYWQVQRLHWKENLIAQVEKYQNSPPEEFHIVNFNQKNDLFKKISLKGHFLHEHEILLSAKYFSSARDKNELGYHVITPFETNEGIIVFVNRGWVPEQYKTKASRPDSLFNDKNETNIEGLVRESAGHAPWYMPKNNAEKNIWFWIDIPAMTTMLEQKQNLKNIKPVLIQQTILTTYNNFKYPVPIPAHLEFYNQHLTYIITWFSLSLVTLVMWIIYIRNNPVKPETKANEDESLPDPLR